MITGLIQATYLGLCLGLILSVAAGVLKLFGVIQ